MVHRIEETLARGICVGCGACSLASLGAVRVSVGDLGIYQADLEGASEEAIRAASRVCPFSDEAPNEDALGVPSRDASITKHSLLGPYSSVFAGRVSDEVYTSQSSSGGLASWFTQRLVEAGVVDGVINVGRPNCGDDLFAYDSTTEPDQAGRRKSAYYATCMSDVLTRLESTPGRFAFVGLPCYVKAARALCVERPDLARKLVVFIGLVCGHMKTHAFAESMAWQIGVPPDKLESVDFRVKRAGRTSSDYDFGAKAVDDPAWKYSRVRSLVGGNWGHGLFQPECCNFCDDVVSETASISFGDAWLPRFLGDARGTNIVICRDPALQRYFDDADEAGEITLEALSVEEAVASQAGGFRHRREGLAVRLADDIAAGLSVPAKRVLPNVKSVAPSRARLIRQRRQLSTRSHAVFREAREIGDLDLFLGLMRDQIARYQRIAEPLPTRMVRRVRSLAGRLLRSFSGPS